MCLDASSYIQTMNTNSVTAHQRHFVDRADADVHTEHVENMWMRAKRKLRCQFGTSHALSARVCFAQQVPRSGHVSHHPEDNC